MGNWGNNIRIWWKCLVHPETAHELVLEEVKPTGFGRSLLLGIAVLYAVYGLSMGLFRGAYPGLVAAFKLPFLFLFTQLICFLPFYVLNCLMGPRLKINYCYRLLLLATSANAIALASYTPISYFFTLTTSKMGYHFLVLMHVAVFTVAGMLSIVVIMLVVRSTASRLKYRIRPAFILAWGLLYAFVGTQMAWVLRPWIGTWTVPYAPFRPLEGSFIESVIRLLL
jgi:hypothetical protein